MPCQATHARYPICPGRSCELDTPERLLSPLWSGSGADAPGTWATDRPGAGWEASGQPASGGRSVLLSAPKRSEEARSPKPVRTSAALSTSDPPLADGTGGRRAGEGSRRRRTSGWPARKAGEPDPLLRHGPYQEVGNLRKQGMSHYALPMSREAVAPLDLATTMRNKNPL